MNRSQNDEDVPMQLVQNQGQMNSGREGSNPFQTQQRMRPTSTEGISQSQQESAAALMYQRNQQQQMYLQQQMRGGGMPQGGQMSSGQRGGMMPPGMYPQGLPGSSYPSGMGSRPQMMGYSGGDSHHQSSQSFYQAPPTNYMSGSGATGQSQQQQQQMQQNQSANQLIGPLDLRGITQKISAKEVLDSQVEKTLAFLAEDFVKTVAEFSCKLAKHRGSDTLEKEDIKFAIEKLYNIPTPIKPNPDKPSSQQLTQQQITNVSTNNFKQNMILVKKAQELNTNVQMK